MCPTCHAATPPGALSCHRCGADLSARCLGCDAPVPPGLELCPACRTERLPFVDLSPAQLEEADATPTRLQAQAPLIGRAVELARLATLATEAATRRQARFCLVVAPPGLGKTRLLHELTQVLVVRANPPLRVLHATVVENAPPLAVFAELICQRFEIELLGLGQGLGVELGAEDQTGGRLGGRLGGSRGPNGGANGAIETAESARDKLLRGCRALLQGVRATEVAHLLAELLRLPFPEGPLGESRTTRERPESRPGPRLYLAIKRLLAADTARGPIALLIDNMEHASQESVNLLHYLAAGLHDSPLFLCAFARPELDEVHPGFGRGDVPCERIELPPLSPLDSGTMLRSLVRGAGEPPFPVLRHAERALGGSPRAVVELVRLLLEVGALRLGQHPLTDARPGGGPPGWDDAKLLRLPLPESLDGLVASRLSAMDAAQREVLEHAAICGEHFFIDAVVAQLRARETGLGMPQGPGGGPSADPDGPLLEEIVVAGDRATHQVTATLTQLTRRGLMIELLQSAIRGEREFRFAYSPWRDVIYDSIAAAERRRLHGMVAQWLDLAPDSGSEERQEAIGRHLERAGKGDAAAARYLRVAELARDRYAHAKATRLFARAIACLGTADLATRIRLWHELGRVFHGRGDYDNALSAYEKVVRLSWVAASRGQAAVALLHTGQIWRQKGELQLALDYLGQALDLFQQSGDQLGVTDALDDIGQVLWLLGRYGDALDRSAAALEARRRLAQRGKVATSLLNIGNIERHRGLFAAAEACYNEALALRRADGDKTGIAACLNAVGMLAYQRGDGLAARRAWEEALVLVEEVGASPLRAVLLCHLGESLMLQAGPGGPGHGGQGASYGEAESRILAAQALSQELSDKRLLSESARLLGIIALRQGRPDEAQRRCEHALALAIEAGVRVDEGRALLALGEVHAGPLFDESRGGDRPAEAYYRRGIALFRDLGNAAELAAGLLRLGRYYIERGDNEAGRGALNEAEEIFTRLGVRTEEVREMLSEL